MLQYRLKYETVRTQMPFPENNFLFNIFSLLSIFNSMFSLSSHCFLSPSTSLGLSVLVALSVLACFSVYISRSLCSGPLAIADLTTLISPCRSCHAERQKSPGSPLITTRFATKRNSSVKDMVAGSETSISDGDGGGLGCGLFDLVDGMRFVEFYN